MLEGSAKEDRRKVGGGALTPRGMADEGVFLRSTLWYGFTSGSDFSGSEQLKKYYDRRWSPISTSATCIANQAAVWKLAPTQVESCCTRIEYAPLEPQRPRCGICLKRGGVAAPP